MNILAAILALVMTWTVESKNSVAPSGDIPPGITAEYKCSFRKGDVRQGDTATLVLSHPGGLTITRIELFLKSNVSSGSGDIAVLADGQEISALSGSFSEWIGAYDNSAYHPLVLFSDASLACHQLTIRVLGTANSLHLSHFTISYQPAQSHMVTLKTGYETVGVLTEPYAGAGVVLPSLPDLESRYLVGWSSVEFWSSSSVTWIPVSHTFYPHEDMVLWSVWRYADTPDAYVSEPVSGEYIYLNRQSSMAMSGVPSDGLLDCAPLGSDEEQQTYEIVFLSPDSATIRHTASGAYIGASGSKLTTRKTCWHVRHEGEETLFYTLVNGIPYALFAGLIDASDPDDMFSYTGLVRMGDTPSPMVLRRTSADLVPVYTCHPEVGQGISAPISDTDPDSASFRGYIIPFGNYHLLIRQGRKSLRME